jgi:hypothetical protein
MKTYLSNKEEEQESKEPKSPEQNPWFDYNNAKNNENRAHAYQLHWKWNPLLKRFWEMCVNIAAAADE